MQYRAEFFVGMLMTLLLRLLERGADVRLVDAAPDHRRLVARGGGARDRVVHLLARDPRRRGAAVACKRRRAHPQRHARLRAAQARRRAVPRVDREVRGVQLRRRDARPWRWRSGRCIGCIACRRRSSSRPRSCSPSPAAALLYALAILVISAAFYVVRLDNLIYLFNSVFDAARWPASVFRGVLARALHLRHAARAHDDLSGAGAARPARRAAPRCARSAALLIFVIWRAPCGSDRSDTIVGVVLGYRSARGPRTTTDLQGRAGARRRIGAAGVRQQRDDGRDAAPRPRSASATPPTCRERRRQHPDEPGARHDVFVCHDADGYLRGRRRLHASRLRRRAQERGRSEAGLRLPVPRCDL